MEKTLPPDRSHFRFMHRLRVRWAEVDLQKIVFNPHYLMYLDTAMADYWRAMALPYESAMHQLGGDLYVKKSSLEFFASARYDDLLDIGLRCERIGNSSMVFSGGVFLGEKLLVTGELIYVFANPATQTSLPVPDALRQTLLGYEKGEPVCTIQTGTWDDLQKEACLLRREVFVEEQGIPVELEWDEHDAQAIHAVTLNRLGMPVATGRLTSHAPGVSRIGRMAVARVLRGTKLGKDLLRVLVEKSRSRGDRKIILHAQKTAEGFYSREGFLSQGEPFTEAGIQHIEMVLDL